MTPISVTIPPAGPAQGKGRVLLDSEDGTATVKEVDERQFEHGTVMVGAHFGTASASSVKEHAVSVTPCVVDFTLGGHELHFVGSNRGEFTRDAVQVINATPNVEAYRVALDEHRNWNAGAGVGAIYLEVFGLTGMTVGGALITLSQTSERQRGVLPAGIAVAGVGLGLLIAGLVLHKSAQGERRPGAVTHWTVSASRN